MFAEGGRGGRRGGRRGGVGRVGDPAARGGPCALSGGRTPIAVGEHRSCAGPDLSIGAAAARTTRFRPNPLTGARIQGLVPNCSWIEVALTSTNLCECI